MNHTLYIETLGCAKNRVDSEIMLASLVSGGYKSVQHPEQAQVILLNTCGFLTSAVNESLERFLELAQYKDKNKGLCECLVVAGCMSQRYQADLLKELPEADAVMGTSDYTQILMVVNQGLLNKERKAWFGPQVGYDSANLQAPRIQSTLSHYSWVKVAEGCSNMCSFCNIPSLRGAFHSKTIRQVVLECEALLSKGVKELNLIAQDTSSFGVDQGENLLGLVNHLSELSGDFWVRLFYSYPNRYPTELFDLMNQDKRFVPYLDLPFQHISDRILKGMNRKITQKELFSLLDLADQRLGTYAFRTSLIVGFPGETEAEFQELLGFVHSGRIDHLGVFPYSDEDNIRSNRLDGKLQPGLIEERCAELMAAQQAVALRKNQQQIGQTQKVLVEGVSQETDLLLAGRTAFQAVEVDGGVLINEGFAEAGTFAQVEITEAHPYDLIGRIIE